jgi:hypothetical protein
MPGDDERRRETSTERSDRRRQVGKVANGTASLGTRSILMPETGADGQEENSQGSGTKARKMDPVTGLLLAVSRHQRKPQGNTHVKSGMLAQM